MTFKLDRITRNVREFVKLWDFFRQHNVEIISVRENINTSCPYGKAMLVILMVFSELEGNMTQEVATVS